MIDALRYDKVARRILMGGLILLVIAVILLVVGFPRSAPTGAVSATVPPTPTTTEAPFVFPTDTTGPPSPTRPPTPSPEPVSHVAPRPTRVPTTSPLPAPPAASLLTPLARPIIYSVMGASDSLGVGAADPAHDAWPAVLATHLPAGTRVQNHAIGGIVLNEALQRELPAVLADQPTLVTVWLAANDASRGVPVPVYQGQLTTLLTQLTSRTKAQIVLLNLPDLSLVLSPSAMPGGAPAIRGRVVAWNQAMAAAAAPFGKRVLLVDLFPQSGRVMQDSSVLSGDNWHPSTAGYRAIADFVLSEMHRTGLLANP